MRIVCDKNMPLAGEAFATLGEVSTRDGRSINASDVRNAELLLTRSTTKINAALLQDSQVRFYGSGVIGTDHIDIPWLEERGIVWSSAPGCNAESVANYVTAALLWLGGRHSLSLAGKCIGVIGAGNVGRRVSRHARALGLRVLICDPPRQRNPADFEAQEFVPLARILAEADIVTCHVPLTRSGPDATHHMLSTREFAAMRPGAVFINAARGAVIDTDALLAALGRNIAHTVIDCWEGEPSYRADLLKRADLATPHIAGHSFEGKVNGTAIVYRAACAFLNIAPSYGFELPPATASPLRLVASGRDDEELLRELVLAVYDIEADDHRLRQADLAAPEARAAAFDQQRAHYPMRREFASTRVEITDATPGLLAKIAGLGFSLERKD